MCLLSQLFFPRWVTPHLDPDSLVKSSYEYGFDFAGNTLIDCDFGRISLLLTNTDSKNADPDPQKGPTYCM